MNLLNPIALAFAALVPLIVVLYLLKLRRQPASVSTLMFWQRVTADNRRRALFQRLRQILSLLLQLLIFGLLLFALARPEFASFRGAEAGLSTVVVLDARARMQARTADGGTRFAQARRIAESYLNRASPRQPVALLTAESAPRVVVGLTGEERALLTGLEDIHPADAGGRIEDAVRLAADLLAAHPGGKRVIVVTDRAPDLPLPKTESPVQIETRLIPAASEGPRENVGITLLTARPLPNSPETDEVLIEVENFGARRQTGNVELSFEGQILDVKPFDLAPGERRADIYPALGSRTRIANPRGWLAAHLDLPDEAKTADAYSPDDDAYAVVPPPRPLRVLLVTKGDWFLESLLRADDRVQFDQLEPGAFQPAQAAGFDAVVLDDFVPDGMTLDALPKGNFLFLGRGPFADGSEALEHPPITDVDSGSSLLYLVNLRDVTVLRARSWTLPETPANATNPWRFAAPVRSLDRPLVVTGERKGQRLVAMAFGAADSDLPLRVAFPLLIHNAIQTLAGRDEAADVAGSSVRAGETVALGPGESTWSHPQTGYQPLPVGGIPETERVSGPRVFQPMRNGYYLRHGADGADSWLAVNTGDRAMSALNAPGAPSVSESAPAPTAARFAGWWEAARVWPPWVYLALIAFTICALEWWGFHRRRTE